MTRHLLTLGALLALVALTTGLAFVDMGAGNIVASLAIAGAKTLLVALIFMGLAGANLHLRLTAATVVYWLILLIGLTIWVSLA